MFLGLDLVLYILGYLFTVYVTLIRLIVLYSRCRVNRGTNMSVVLYYVILILASTARLGLLCWAFPTCGVRPHHAVVRSVTFGFGAGDSASFPTPPFSPLRTSPYLWICVVKICSGMLINRTGRRRTLGWET